MAYINLFWSYSPQFQSSYFQKVCQPLRAGNIMLCTHRCTFLVLAVFFTKQVQGAEDRCDQVLDDYLSYQNPPQSWYRLPSCKCFDHCNTSDLCHWPDSQILSPCRAFHQENNDPIRVPRCGCDSLCSIYGDCCAKGDYQPLLCDNPNQASTVKFAGGLNATDKNKLKVSTWL